LKRRDRVRVTFRPGGESGFTYVARVIRLFFSMDDERVLSPAGRLSDLNLESVLK
jgi:hypothetical protein